MKYKIGDVVTIKNRWVNYGDIGVIEGYTHSWFHIVYCVTMSEVKKGHRTKRTGKGFADHELIKIGKL